MGHQRGGGGGCSLCRLINIGITLALLGGAGYVIWYFLGQPSGEDIKNTFGNINFGDFSDVLQNFTGFGSDLWNKDPYVGDNTTNVWLGTTGVGGLSLELWNALDESWQTEFAESFSDWDNCDPNALTLSTQRVEVDYACSHATGVMKVCNGNYGETGWLGINEVTKIMPQNAIESSVAKMNEYYLNNAGYEERLYTMCHEIGHGFGLPHTDENFHNADLGNCLDYTTRPQNNLRPGEYNCNRLKTMYGSVDGSRRERFLRNVAEDPAYLSSGIGGSLRSESSSSTDGSVYDQAMEDLRSYILSRNNDKNRILHDGDVEAVEGEWRMIRNHPRGGAFVRKLKDDLVLEVHVIYPFN
ncbi:hypothetical protein IV203_020779 [Nitzschia inconspicua]|uniref:Uncharacterized protein n=1 Tax=Nitzschia inconspicua TaxID=303405 RepID=A0A9K3PDC8_9STRA|nr:hypothetical protein IV203_020779 [Nitzschia inconspicua]